MKATAQCRQNVGNAGLVDCSALGLDTPAGVHSGAGLVFAAKQIDVISGWMLTVLGQSLFALVSVVKTPHPDPF